ncbi:hypothetical protein BC831DRAFT_268169 [Entophlyctis helioformis]|nr:hypothetical protein BC831DRAFT_268169 [Entophlyctis helioformis]
MYNFPALFPDLQLFSTTVKKLQSITDADHLKAILELLHQHMTIFASDGVTMADQLASAGIMGALKRILANDEASKSDDLFSALSLLVSRILLRVDQQASDVAYSAVVGRIIAAFNPPGHARAEAALGCIHVTIQDPNNGSDALVPAYLHHGIAPAMHKLLLLLSSSSSSTESSSLSKAIEVVDCLLTWYKHSDSNPTADAMQAIGMPSLLQQLAESHRLSSVVVKRIIAILRTFFGTELEPGDTNYETNEYNIDLPIALIPSAEQPHLTVKERQYLGLLGSVLAKPQWWIKLKDAATAATWHAEATERGFSKRAVGLLFSELAYLAEHGIRTAELASGEVVTLTPGAVKCTVMSDDALPQPLRDTLVRQVAVLEDVPRYKKDWHPGSSGTVLDLVSTSLYPLTYGRTLVLACIHRAAANSMPPWDILGAAETVADAPTVFDELDDDVYAASEPSQVLPSEFHIHEDGTVSINSYINNLHPVWHKPLYTTIAKVFERFVPLFESLFGHSSGLVPYITNPGEVYTTRDALRCLLRTMPELPSEDDDEGYRQAKDIIDGYVEGEDDRDDDAGNPGDHQASGFLHPRLPDSFLPPAALPTPVILRDRSLQVVVKLVSIHLSPESPEYHGSSWHTEGSQTEPIVATGICYYAMDNVTTPRLSFQSETPTFEAWLTRYDQTEYDYLEEVYGFHDDASMRVQSVGAMDAVEGRCIAFPNSWQHRQEPFRLADPTRAGHAKMLVFWVVDPVKRVVSTAHVAPQQMDWYATGVVAHGLPADLAMHIGPHIRGAISLESARQTRSEQHDKQQAGQSAEDLSMFGMGGF